MRVRDAQPTHGFYLISSLRLPSEHPSIGAVPGNSLPPPAPVSAPTLCQLTNTTHSTCGPLIIHGILTVVLIVMDEHHVTFGVDKVIQSLFAFPVKVCFANYITNFSPV